MIHKAFEFEECLFDLSIIFAICNVLYIYIHNRIFNSQVSSNLNFGMQQKAKLICIY